MMWGRPEASKNQKQKKEGSKAWDYEEGPRKSRTRIQGKLQRAVTQPPQGGAS